ncbi:MAG: hypothetical protein RIQ89_2374 [Bacteroidota bacterium]|jgi:membrane associated rhomboid family serine protease
MNNFSFNWRTMDIVQKLIAVNLFVFALLFLSGLIATLTMSEPSANNFITNLFVMPTYLPIFIRRPWTIVTYMFSHKAFFHLLFNMLYLFFMGKFLLSILGEKKVLALYLLGGIAGGVFQLIAENAIPLYIVNNNFPPVLGASASAMALLIAAAALMPEQEVILFIFPIRLKYVALLTILIDVLYLSSNDNVAHFAHLGGAAMGYLFIASMKKGIDLSKWLNFNKAFFSSKKTKMKVNFNDAYSPRNDEQFNQRKQSEQDQLDAILDKLSKSGYGSLSDAEKTFLFRYSKKK